MSSTPAAPQWSASAAWPLGILVAGVVIIATLMWVSWLVGVWASVRGVADWLLESAYFLPPYALCAIGLWLGRRERRLRWAVRGVGLLMVALALPSLFVAASTVREFWGTKTQSVILPHMFVAFLTLPLQYGLAFVALAVGWVMRQRPVEVAAEPGDAVW